MRESIDLDSFDLRLLTLLQENGRLTSQQIGDRIGLSPSQCSRRRAALEAAGIVRGYHAELDEALLGFDVLVFVHVTLGAHGADRGRRFRELVAGLPEVQEAYSVTGDTDYLLRAVVRDLRGLSELLNDKLLGHDTVARVRSSLVLERLKETRSLHLGA